MKLGFGVVFAAVAILAWTPEPMAYLKLGTAVGGNVVGLKWTGGRIPYFVTNSGTSGVDAPQLAAAVERAFQTWGAVDDVTIDPQFIGFTDARPFVEDGISVIGFVARSDLTRTLGATRFVVDSVTGELLESDIFFNTSFDWSVAPQGEPGRHDLESIAVHEVGHLLGLNHSALGETELTDSGQRRVLAKGAIMFPIAFPPGTIHDRTLTADDTAGIVDLYGPPPSSQRLGSIEGRVTRSGAGVFGAHVTAFNPSVGLVGTFTLNAQGSFVLSGLEPGLYVVRAEPLDDAEPSSFFSEDDAVDTDFRPAYASRLVAVPEGGSVGSVEIQVVRK